MMDRDISDILDRWSIAKLKTERIGTEENKRELEAFDAELLKIQSKYPQYDWSQWCDLMIDINNFIWQLESGLKSGKEKLENPIYLLDEKNQKALANIGLTSVLIRNFNHIRVAYKNMINKIMETGFQDKKSSHLSE